MYFELKVLFINLFCIVNIAFNHYVDSKSADLNEAEFWNKTDRTKRGTGSYCKSSTSDSTSDYVGNVQTTRSGKTCQRWDSQTPHVPQASLVVAGNFPDSSVSDAENSCRNIDNDGNGPWCYTMDPSTRWEYCDIPLCSNWNEEQKKFCRTCMSYYDTIEEAKNSCEQDSTCGAIYDLFCDGNGKFGICKTFSVIDQTHLDGIDCIHRKGY